MITMPHWPQPLFHKPINYNLENITKFLEHLDNPHLQLKNVIHVTGTNGKGSTVSFIRTILEQAGYKVNTYTSPHLLKFNERIKVHGVDVSDNYLHELAEKCRIVSEKHGDVLTFFEGTTAMAFLAFAENPADYNILEVGMGGRLDATNVVENTKLCVFTPISYDHTDYLGPTLSMIAREKAGIIKQGAKIVVSQQTEEAMNIFMENEDIFAFEYDYIVHVNDDGSFVYQDQNHRFILDKPGLAGKHQYLNAATSIASVLQLDDPKITPEIINSGIKSTYWPARLEKLNKGQIVNMLPDNFELYVDGAHNQSGAQALALFIEESPEYDTYLIAGITKGRDCVGFFNYFKDKVKLIAGLRVENEPSSYSAEHIAKEGETAGIPSKGFDTLFDAVDYIKTMAGDRKSRIIVCGSLYLAGEFLEHNYLGKQKAFQ